CTGSGSGWGTTGKPAGASRRRWSGAAGRAPGPGDARSARSRCISPFRGSVAILGETAGPSVELVCALVALGQSRLLAGDLVGAARVLAEALGVARAVRPHYWITYALYWQGCVAQARGDLPAARAAVDEGVAL